VSKVCPQRIIAEAIRLLEQYPSHTSMDVNVEVDECIEELEGLSKALYRDGIINIVEFKS